jgi:hypothetical protein
MRFARWRDLQRRGAIEREVRGISAQGGMIAKMGLYTNTTPAALFQTAIVGLKVHECRNVGPVSDPGRRIIGDKSMHFDEGELPPCRLRRGAS